MSSVTRSLDLHIFVVFLSVTNNSTRVEMNRAKLIYITRVMLFLGWPLFNSIWVSENGKATTRCPRTIKYTNYLKARFYNRGFCSWVKKLFLIQLLLCKIVQIDRVRFFAAQIVALRQWLNYESTKIAKILIRFCHRRRPSCPTFSALVAEV